MRKSSVSFLYLVSYSFDHAIRWSTRHSLKDRGQQKKRWRRWKFDRHFMSKHLLLAGRTGMSTAILKVPPLATASRRD